MKLRNKQAKKTAVPIVAYVLHEIVSLTSVIEERCELIGDVASLLENAEAKIKMTKYQARLEQIVTEARNQITSRATALTVDGPEDQQEMARADIADQLRSSVRLELAIQCAKGTSDKWKSLHPLTLPAIATAVGVGALAVFYAAKHLKAGEDPAVALAKGQELEAEVLKARALQEAAKKLLEDAEKEKEAREKRLKEYQRQHPGLGLDCQPPK